MASHGINNRPPRRRMTDAIQPEAPSLLAMLWPLLGALAILGVWLVAVELILSH